MFLTLAMNPFDSVMDKIDWSEKNDRQNHFPL